MRYSFSVHDDTGFNVLAGHTEVEYLDYPSMPQRTGQAGQEIFCPSLFEKQ